MTKPSVGRIVHYYPQGDEEPFAAIITAVHADDSVSLAVFSANGSQSSVNCPVTLYGKGKKPKRKKGDDGEEPVMDAYCAWPEEVH